MESRLTVHMLDYLLEHRFASKKALASRLDISYRALLRIYQGQSSRYDIQNIFIEEFRMKILTGKGGLIFFDARESHCLSDAFMLC